MLTAPYMNDSWNWVGSCLYRYNFSTNLVEKISLEQIDEREEEEKVVLARSLTYSKERGLFINVMPSFDYFWFEEQNFGFWKNYNGGIYRYNGENFEKVFENLDGIFNSGISYDGKIYAVDAYGNVFVETNEGFEILVKNLFIMLKNVSFSNNKNVIYITTFGGGTYKINL